MKLAVDWARINSVEAFYDYLLPILDAPKWHGRNLDALHDSVVNAGIYQSGPPFYIKHINSSKRLAAIGEFQLAVIAIFASSIIENGGEQIIQD